MPKNEILSHKARKCEICQTEFKAKTSWQRFCGIPCHNKYWQGKRSPLDSRVNALEARVAALELIIDRIPKA